MATVPDLDHDALALDRVALFRHASETAGAPLRTLAWKAIAGGERVAALALLILLLPGLCAAAIAVMLLSRQRPLIAHARVGRRGKEIWVLKLRTMWGASVPRRGTKRGLLVERLKGEPVPDIKVADPRVTSAFAVACRKYSIDELPQLWQVVRGELSLVGPRPLTSEELRTHYGREAAAAVLQIKPGLTGLWQIRGRNSLSYRQRRAFDLFLARRWSPRLYFGILLATVPRVLTGQDAW